MNKILLIQFFISSFLLSQVGINIDDPKATLHIESYAITRDVNNKRDVLFDVMITTDLTNFSLT